jgi:hypothetical protein
VGQKRLMSTSLQIKQEMDVHFFYVQVNDTVLEIYSFLFPKEKGEFGALFTSARVEEEVGGDTETEASTTTMFDGTSNSGLSTGHLGSSPSKSSSSVSESFSLAD